MERRAFLLAERERLRRAILGAAGTEFPVAQLIVSPERGATAEQIRGDVLNLQVAAFRLSIEKPAGVPPEKPDFGRAPAGESPYRPLSERTDGPLRHRRWVAKRAAEVHDLLARAWDPKLASEELLLEASLRYWDGRIRDALEARGLQR